MLRKTKPSHVELSTWEVGSRERGLLPARPLRDGDLRLAVLIKDQRTRQRARGGYGGPKGGFVSFG